MRSAQFRAAHRRGSVRVWDRVGPPEAGQQCNAGFEARAAWLVRKQQAAALYDYCAPNRVFSVRARPRARLTAHPHGCKRLQDDYLLHWRFALHDMLQLSGCFCSCARSRSTSARITSASASAKAWLRSAASSFSSSASTSRRELAAAERDAAAQPAGVSCGGAGTRDGMPPAEGTGRAGGTRGQSCGCLQGMLHCRAFEGGGC